MLFGCASRTVNVYGSGGILRYGSLLLRTGCPPFFTISVAISMITASTSELKNVRR